MNLREFIKPTKKSLEIFFDYSFFLLAINIFLAVVLSNLIEFFVSGRYGFFTVRNPADTTGWYVFSAIILLLIYTEAQALAQWLKKHESEGAWWRVRSVGAILSILTVFLVLFGLSIF